MEDHGYCCVCVLCVSYVLRVFICVILFSSVTVFMLCMCTYYFLVIICRSWVLGSVSMLNKCQNLHIVFNGKWLACYCFYGAVWTIVLYCVMFLSAEYTTWSSIGVSTVRV